MARTVLSTQSLAALAGQTLPWVPVDVANGMQVRNSGVQVVAVMTGTGSQVTLTFPSQPDAYGRTGDVVVQQVTGSNVNPKLQLYGPFPNPTMWGDAASNLFINPSALTGSASIAVITI